MTATQVHIAAFYHFIDLTTDQVTALAEWLRVRCSELEIRGLYILGTEGLNSTISGQEANVKQLLIDLNTHLGIQIQAKWTTAPKHPFRRLIIKKKSEIVTTWDPTLKPMPVEAGTHLSPDDWEKAMNEGAIVIDTRNDYESKIGAFAGAIKPPIKDFSEFGDWLKENPVPKDKKVLIYCTGGIRCEKAIDEMKREGYDQTYQLGGGIITYLQEKPESKFEGECFVFDHRIALDQKLKPTEKYLCCLQCGHPTENRKNCQDCGKEFGFCPTCLANPHELQGRIKEGIFCSPMCATGSRPKRTKPKVRTPKSSRDPLSIESQYPAVIVKSVPSANG